MTTPGNRLLAGITAVRLSVVRECQVAPEVASYARGQVVEVECQWGLVSPLRQSHERTSRRNSTAFAVRTVHPRPIELTVVRAALTSQHVVDPSQCGVGRVHFERGVMIRLGVPDMISPSYFPAIVAVKLGICQSLGLDVELHLVFPVTTTYDQLRDGGLDYVAGAAHAALYSFDQWVGINLLCALSRHSYWFLVVRADLSIQRGDLLALKGLRIGAAPGPDDALRMMLVDAGTDPDDVEIGPVRGTDDGGVSFGVTAAEALERGDIDGFWANAMGAEVAIRRGVGRLIVDVRRGDGTPGARDFTFPALSTTSARTARERDEVAAMTRAIVETQRSLQADPSLAGSAVEALFPDFEASLISELVRRDAPFYEPAITAAAIGSMSEFANRLGLRTPATPPNDLVPSFAAEVWGR